MKTDIRYWQSLLREAERELECRDYAHDLECLAKKLMRTKAELKRLEAKAST